LRAPSAVETRVKVDPVKPLRILENCWRGVGRPKRNRFHAVRRGARPRDERLAVYYRTLSSIPQTTPRTPAALSASKTIESGNSESMTHKHRENERRVASSKKLPTCAKALLIRAPYHSRSLALSAAHNPGSSRHPKLSSPLAHSRRAFYPVQYVRSQLNTART
jgi:hypothetical protein